MSKTIQVLFECNESDTGDRTYRVSSRMGSSGEIPPRFVIHDSHCSDDALKALRSAAKAAVAKQIDKIDGPRKGDAEIWLRAI